MGVARVMADGSFGATFYQSVSPDVFTEVVSTLAYNDGNRHHAAAVIRNVLVELYVDGVLVAQDTTNPIGSVQTPTQTVVGQIASSFLGKIDEIRIFTRALADGEIAALAPSSPHDNRHTSANLSRAGSPVDATLPRTAVRSTLNEAASEVIPDRTHALEITVIGCLGVRETTLSVAVAAWYTISSKRDDAPSCSYSNDSHP